MLFTALQKAIRLNIPYNNMGLQVLTVMHPCYLLPHVTNTSCSYTRFYTGAVVIPLPVVLQGKLRNLRVHRVVQRRVLVTCPSYFKGIKPPAWATQTPIPNPKHTNNSLIQMRSIQADNLINEQKKALAKWQGLCFDR